MGLSFIIMLLMSMTHMVMFFNISAVDVARTRQSWNLFHRFGAVTREELKYIEAIKEDKELDELPLKLTLAVKFCLLDVNYRSLLVIWLKRFIYMLCTTFLVLLCINSMKFNYVIVFGVYLIYTGSMATVATFLEKVSRERMVGILMGEVPRGEIDSYFKDENDNGDEFNG